MIYAIVFAKKCEYKIVFDMFFFLFFVKMLLINFNFTLTHIDFLKKYNYLAFMNFIYNFNNFK